MVGTWWNSKAKVRILFGSIFPPLTLLLPWGAFTCSPGFRLAWVQLIPLLWSFYNANQIMPHFFLKFLSGTLWLIEQSTMWPRLISPTQWVSHNSLPEPSLWTHWMTHSSQNAPCTHTPPYLTLLGILFPSFCACKSSVCSSRFSSPSNLSVFLKRSELALTLKCFNII